MTGQPRHDLTIDPMTDAGDAPIEAVGALLRAHNESYVGPRDFQRLALFARDATGTIQGGLVGQTSRGWAYVDMLAIAPAFRGTGLGSDLLAQAEAIARTRGCVGIYLNTFSFQAPAFYKMRGYSEFGRLKDFPPGHTNVWLMKRL
jgi:GNAT superfamily N-acetyltransferase